MWDFVSTSQPLFFHWSCRKLMSGSYCCLEIWGTETAGAMYCTTETTTWSEFLTRSAGTIRGCRMETVLWRWLFHGYLWDTRVHGLETTALTEHPPLNMYSLWASPSFSSMDRKEEEERWAQVDRQKQVHPPISLLSEAIKKKTGLMDESPLYTPIDSWYHFSSPWL